MGHVKDRHIKKKIRLAYAGSAVRKAIASQRNEAGLMARSAVGALVEKLANTQYSQQEERAADDHGVLYLQTRGHDVHAAVSALTKLAARGNRHTLLSSHPAPTKRAQRMQADNYDPQAVIASAFLDRLGAWLKRWWPFPREGDEQG
jgi:putative metalloprotease